jgi:inositol transport system ATP-binding protein
LSRTFRGLKEQRLMLLEIENVAKWFSGVPVLRDVSLSIAAGEVHALAGENGAGKSTLMKILAGMHAPDAGEVRLAGRRLGPGSPPSSLRAGIAMIYQELMSFPDLTVAENIFIGHEPASQFPGWIDKREMNRRTTELLAGLGVELPPTTRMRDLRLAEMQTVEIAKALAHRAKVIIMDEPTSALSEREAEALFRIIRELRQSGATVIYVSHKLEEVFRLADRVTVMRDGMVVATHPIGELTSDRLVALMVGRPTNPQAAGTRATKGEVALSVRGLCKAKRFRDVSFEVRRGEVLGLAGLMGAGRTDVVNAIYGLAPADAGDIVVAGRPRRIRHTRDALAAGIGLVSEDRKLFGFVPGLGLRRNMTLAALSRWSSGGWINQAAERKAAEDQVRALSIRSATLDQPVEHLSGGNQQKAVLARTLLAAPEVLLLDEPTRGIDVGAKAEVHALVSQFASQGKAVVLVSSQLPELFSLSDRILVMRQGELAGEFLTHQTTPEEVLRVALPK